MPILQLLNSPRAGMQWFVTHDPFSIGRDHRCNAEIDDDDGMRPKSPSISRRHARITYANGEWTIEDGDGAGKLSRNGLSINDAILSPREHWALRDRDIIKICNLRFIFLMDLKSDFNEEASLGQNDSTTYMESQPPDRLRQILEIGAILRGTLDADAVLDRTVEHLFHMFPQAQRALVFLTKNEGGPQFHTLRGSHGKPADPLYSFSVIRRCFDSRKALLGNDTDLPVQFPDSESISYLNSRSLMCTPLWTSNGNSLGVVQLDARSDHRKFTEHDLRLLLAVANQASIAFSNALLHQQIIANRERAKELELAKQVQLALLPRERPRLAGYEFFTHYQSAQEVGGDYYDFIPLPDSRLAVLLGDVAGHGVAAALVVAKFSVEARVCLEISPDPAQALNRLNAQMLRSGLPCDRYVTLALAVLDPKTHAVTLLSAGHPAHLLVRASGEVRAVPNEKITGSPFGIDSKTTYQSQEVRLQPGDRLVMFSDGVSDAFNTGGTRFGVEGIQRAVASAALGTNATGERLLQAVAQHMENCEQNDDITVVCFGRVS